MSDSSIRLLFLPFHSSVETWVSRLLRIVRQHLRGNLGFWRVQVLNGCISRVYCPPPPPPALSALTKKGNIALYRGYFMIDLG